MVLCNCDFIDREFCYAFVSTARFSFLNLGITQLIDRLNFVASENEGAFGVGISGSIFLIDVAIASAFIALGYAARKRKMNAYGFLPLYFGDSLLAFVLKDYLSFAFHFVAMYMIFTGYRTAKLLLSLERGHFSLLIPNPDRQRSRSKWVIRFWYAVITLSLLFFILFNYQMLR